MTHKTKTIIINRVHRAIEVLKRKILIVSYIISSSWDCFHSLNMYMHLHWIVWDFIKPKQKIVLSGLSRLQLQRKVLSLLLKTKIFTSYQWDFVCAPRLSNEIEYILNCRHYLSRVLWFVIQENLRLLSYLFFV